MRLVPYSRRLSNFSNLSIFNLSSLLIQHSQPKISQSILLSLAKLSLAKNFIRQSHTISSREAELEDDKHYVKINEENKCFHELRQKEEKEERMKQEIERQQKEFKKLYPNPEVRNKMQNLKNAKLLILNHGLPLAEAILAAKRLKLNGEAGVDGIEILVNSSRADRLNPDSYPEVKHFERVNLDDWETAKAAIIKFSASLLPGQLGLVFAGYGYLSENEKLPELCKELGLRFMGAPAKAMRRWGDKAEARKTAKQLNVLVIPGFESEGNEDSKTLIAKAKKVGYPFMLKTTDGGGGMGNILILDEKQFIEVLNDPKFPQFKPEKRLVLEKFIKKPRHIEIQAFYGKDSQGKPCYITLLDRDCSVQRRFQKVIEAAPAILIEKLRADILAAVKRMCDDALRQDEPYEGAGTFEFLIDIETGEFYFLEINTRIQVEWRPTKEVTDFDIVEALFHIASGVALDTYLAEMLKKRGHHSIENLSPQQMVDLLRKNNPVKFCFQARINIGNTSEKGLISQAIPSAQNYRGGITTGYRAGDFFDAKDTYGLLALIIGKGASPREAINNLEDHLKKFNMIAYFNITSTQELQDQFFALVSGDTYIAAAKKPDAREFRTNLGDLYKLLTHSMFQPVYQPTTDVCQEVDSGINVAGVLTPPPESDDEDQAAGMSCR